MDGANVRVAGRAQSAIPGKSVPPRFGDRNRQAEQGSASGIRLLAADGQGGMIRALDRVWNANPGEPEQRRQNVRRIERAADARLFIPSFCGYRSRNGTRIDSSQGCSLVVSPCESIM